MKFITHPTPTGDQDGDLSRLAVLGGMGSKGGSDAGPSRSSFQQKEDSTSLIMPAPDRESLSSLPYKRIPGPWHIILEIVHNGKERVDAFFDGYIDHVEKASKKWSFWWNAGK